ncbi:MAG TPA: NAD(P)H-binding protein [Polyangiales bacterium]|nr:NAD(P)H-binding protein [Polyangiales bacterium]
MTGCVWVLGATGVVGQQAVLALLADPSTSRVVAIQRRPVRIDAPKYGEKVVDFEQLETSLAGESADVAVCCLGTTIKQAGSQAQFRHIELDYTLAFARAAQAAGVRHFLVVTALGASPKSLVFYNRVKGEIEQALTDMRFPALTIVRPSLLVGDRKETRLGEKLAEPFMRLLPRSVRGIGVDKVGKALAKLALGPAHGKRVVLSRELHDF